MHGFHQLVLGVALQRGQRVPSSGGAMLQTGVDVVQGLRTVQIRLPSAEQIQIRPMQDQQLGHLSRLRSVQWGDYRTLRGGSRRAVVRGTCALAVTAPRGWPSLASRKAGRRLMASSGGSAAVLACSACATQERTRRTTYSFSVAPWAVAVAHPAQEVAEAAHVVFRQSTSEKWSEPRYTLAKNWLVRLPMGKPHGQHCSQVLGGTAANTCDRPPLRRVHGGSGRLIELHTD